MLPENYTCEGQIALWDYLDIDKREFGIKLKLIRRRSYKKI